MCSSDLPIVSERLLVHETPGAGSAMIGTKLPGSLGDRPDSAQEHCGLVCCSTCLPLLTAGFVGGAEFLKDGDKANILGQNAARLLKITGRLGSMGTL